MELLLYHGHSTAFEKQNIKHRAPNLFPKQLILFSTEGGEVQANSTLKMPLGSYGEITKKIARVIEDADE